MIGLIIVWWKITTNLLLAREFSIKEDGTKIATIKAKNDSMLKCYEIIVWQDDLSSIAIAIALIIDKTYH